MASFFKIALGDIDGGCTLDVASGRGGSIGVVTRNLCSFSKVIAIDNLAKNLSAAKKSHADKGVEFFRMDAGRMGFPDLKFDLVVISNSLHHLENPELVLSEMRRVLKDGGKFVINEPHRDAPSESQLTSVYLHHWIADIDTALGFIHKKTFSRQKILDLSKTLHLKSIKVHDRQLKEKDAFSSTTLRRYEKYYIEKFLKQAKKTSQCDQLCQRGEELRRRLHEVGTQVQEPLILIVGEK